MDGTGAVPEHSSIIGLESLHWARLQSALTAQQLTSRQHEACAHAQKRRLASRTRVLRIAAGALCASMTCTQQCQSTNHCPASSAISQVLAVSESYQ